MIIPVYFPFFQQISCFLHLFFRLCTDINYQTLQDFHMNLSMTRIQRIDSSHSRSHSSPTRIEINVHIDCLVDRQRNRLDKGGCTISFHEFAWKDSKPARGDLHESINRIDHGQPLSCRFRTRSCSLFLFSPPREIQPSWTARDFRSAAVLFLVPVIRRFESIVPPSSRG